MTAIEKGGYDMSETTADDWLKAMQTKNQEMLNWAENMRILAGKIPQEMYEELLAAGPAQSKVVADLAKKTPEQLQPWVNEWKKSGELAKRVAMQELNTISGYSAGKNLALSLADGIKAYSSFPKREAVAMATGVTAGRKLRFEIASPSKVFKRIGEQTAETAEGIELGTSEAVYAANAMAKAVSQNAEMGMDVDWTNLSDPEALRATVGVDTASVASLKQAMASTTMDYERMGLAMRQTIKGLGPEGRARLCHSKSAQTSEPSERRESMITTPLNLWLDGTNVRALERTAPSCPQLSQPPNDSSHTKSRPIRVL